MVNFIFVGKKIREVRKKSGFTQSILAEKAGLSVVYISQIERAKKQVSLNALYNISRTLDVSLDVLVGRKPGISDEADSEMDMILSDCSEYERNVLMENMLNLKQVLKNNTRLLVEEYYLE